MQDSFWWPCFTIYVGLRTMTETLSLSTVWEWSLISDDSQSQVFNVFFYIFVSSVDAQLGWRAGRKNSKFTSQSMFQLLPIVTSSGQWQREELAEISFLVRWGLKTSMRSFFLQKTSFKGESGFPTTFQSLWGTLNPSGLCSEQPLSRRLFGAGVKRLLVLLRGCRRSLTEDGLCDMRQQMATVPAGQAICDSGSCGGKTLV